MLCAFLMKGFVFVGLTAYLMGSAEPGGPAIERLVLNGHCHKFSQDDKAPVGQHADCCVLCAQAHKDTAVANLNSLQIIAILRPADSKDEEAFDVSADAAPSGIPWFGTAWYPTAPPSA